MGQTIVLLGPTGSGKGTQAELLVRMRGFEHFSMGEMIRAEIVSGSVIGRRIASYHQQGHLAPDEITDGLLEAVLRRLPEEADILIDGFPRDLNQIAHLDRMLGKIGRRLDLVIYITLSLKAALTRLRQRGRDDDSESAVREKFGVFEQETKPVVATYRARGVLREVDGEQSVDALS